MFVCVCVFCMCGLVSTPNVVGKTTVATKMPRVDIIVGYYCYHLVTEL